MYSLYTKREQVINIAYLFTMLCCLSNKLQKVNKIQLILFILWVYHFMKRQMAYPLILKFETQLFAYQFLWIRENYLKIDAVQISQPQNCFYGEMINEGGKVDDPIRTLFLHLQEIIVMTHSNKKDYISATVSIIDTSKEFNRVEYKLKVKLFDRENGQIFIPLDFRLNQSILVQKQSNRMSYQIKQVIQPFYHSSKESNVADKITDKQTSSQQLKVIKYRKIQKLIKKDVYLRDKKKIQRKLLRKKQADSRQVCKLTKILQQAQIK